MAEACTGVIKYLFNHFFEVSDPCVEFMAS